MCGRQGETPLSAHSAVGNEWHELGKRTAAESATRKREKRTKEKKRRRKKREKRREERSEETRDKGQAEGIENREDIDERE